MPMTERAVKKWIDEHIKLSYSFIYNTAYSYKIQFDNGETYEYRVLAWNKKRKAFEVFINGEKACNIVNGVYC